MNNEPNCMPMASLGFMPSLKTIKLNKNKNNNNEPTTKNRLINNNNTYSSNKYPILVYSYIKNYLNHPN